MAGLLIRSGRNICTQTLPAAFRLSTSSLNPKIFRFAHSVPTSSDEAQSGRSLFKETEVNPSILKYVQSVGVGKANRKKRRKFKKNTEQSRFLSRSEEMDQLSRIRRLPSTVTPPPFPNNTRRNEKTSSGKTIRRRPVKLLGSVGSVDEEFPKPTALLPEVVRISIGQQIQSKCGAPSGSHSYSVAKSYLYYRRLQGDPTWANPHC
jgi:hypothetical protein